MKYVSLRMVTLIVVLALAAADLSRGIFNTVSFDVFATCISGEAESTSFGCEYAPQIMLHTIGGLVFFLGAFILGFKTSKLMTALQAIGLAVLYIFFQLGMWRFEESLRDNFANLQLSPIPETLGDYSYVALLSLDNLLIGLALSSIVILQLLFGRNTVENKDRNETPKSAPYTIKKNSSPSSRIASSKTAPQKKKTASKKAN